MRRTHALASSAVLVLGMVGCGSDDDASASTRNVQTGWSVPSPPTGAEFQIIVQVGSSSCDSFDRIEVDETSDAVTITAYIDRRDADACTADMAIEEVTVTLDEPLGERSLLGCRQNADDPSFDCR